MTDAASSLVDSLSTVYSDFYANEADAAEKSYNDQVAALDAQLAQGLISETDYEAAKEKLEDDYLAKKNEVALKAFKTNQAANIASVWIDAASAILGWWKSSTALGFPAGPIVAGVMTAATLGMAAAQSVAISQETFVPEYAKGGTTSGGIARINEQGGELVQLPDGTIVVPHDLSAAIAEASGSGASIYVSFDGAVIDKGVDLDKLAGKVSKKIAQKIKDVA